MFSHPITEAHTDHALQALAYAGMPDQRNSAAVQESYGSFIRHTLAQWTALLPHYTFEAWTTGADGAYANSRDMIADAANARHLWVFPTDAAQMDSAHPLAGLVPDSLRVDGLPLLNDVFRAVHDLMGHVVSGGSFGLNGEMKAWLAHRAMYPRTALAALWCETRGQAAWTNAWGDHSTLPLSERPFAEQKAGMPPLALV